jgi:hypothetical protein
MSEDQRGYCEEYQAECTQQRVYFEAGLEVKIPVGDIATVHIIEGVK